MSPIPAARIRHFPQLYRAISRSIVEAFGATNPALKAALHIACAPCVLALARLAIKMEARIARDGDLKGACEWVVSIAADSIHIRKAERIPTGGPLLFVGNHAGMGDAHALLMASPRRDTKLLAHDFGLLPGLSQFRQHVIVVDPARPLASTREALRHLQAGGSLLLYPKGEIEPDPALYPQPARDSLAGWSASMEFFARRAPELAVAPVAVGGLISRSALRNPIVRRYRDHDQRHFLAATFQLMFPRYRDPVIRIVFGEPIRGGQATRANVLRQMAELLPQVGGECASRQPAS